MKIGNNPVARKLANLLGHPDSNHPLKHSAKGFEVELEKIHKEIKSKYSEQTKNQITVGTLKSYITGYRNPQFDSVKKICEAYEIIHNAKIDPYDFYVDEGKWINKDNLSEGQKKIINAIMEIDNENYLEGIEKLCEIALRDKGKSFS